MASFTNPRQVRLKQCLIGSIFRTSTTFLYDLSPFVHSINIYENIFQNTIVATLDIVEADALQEILPIVGGEQILIEFETDRPESEEVYTFSQLFRIHRMINQSFPKNENRHYTLDLVTPEFYNSIGSRMTRRFAHQTASDAVKHVLNNYLNVSPQKLLKSEFESTRDIIDTFIPNYTPLQAINYLTMMARIDTKESNFVFYETLDGFYFKSISKIIADAKKQEPKNIPTFSVNSDQLTGAKTVDLTTAYNSIIHLHQDESFDVIRDIASGALRTKTLQLDFFGRVYSTQDMQYSENFNKLEHLDQYPCYPENFEDIVNENVKQYIIPCNVAASQSKYISQKSPIQYDPIMENIPMRNHQLKTLLRNKTRLMVPGQPRIRAGNVINLFYPSSRMLQQGKDSTPEDVNKNLPRDITPYHSGLHLITHVRHSLLRVSLGAMEYTAHIEVVRDAFGSPLPKFQKQT